MKSAIATALLTCLLWPIAAWAAPPFQPRATVDGRGFVDVWALRRDVIAVEALTPTINSDFCDRERSPDDPPMSKRAAARLAHEEMSCANKAAEQEARFESARAAFNAAWLPKFKAAIGKGDLVAEVIYLQCETTTALDRGEDPSTCNNAKASQALARLREIGFEPAYEPCDGRVQTWQRAFRYCTGEYDIWATDAFRQLRLNRPAALTPGYLTWGRELHRGGGTSPFSGRTFFYATAEHHQARELAIDQLLQREPRWAVFLLTRVGRHEWVPQGTTSATGQLDAAWLGRWRLERGADNWTAPLQPMAGTADIHRVGEAFRITLQTGAGAPLVDATDCPLRYSGGLTYLPKLTGQGQQSAERTALGDFSSTGNGLDASFANDGAADAALAPLNTKKRYRQVLMQCDQAEADGNDRVRFLLLSGDWLLEFATEAPDGRKLAVRHYRREP